jgi:ribosomal protein S27AE
LSSLEPDEQAILSETIRYGGKTGTLYLTNKRLFFEDTVGILSKRSHPTLNLSLEGISDTSIEKAFLSGQKLIVNVKKGFISNFPVRLEFSVKNPTVWQGKITSSVKARIEAIEAQKKKEKVQIVLDFSSLKEYMEKGGLTLQQTKCPNCGAPIKLPQQGNQMTCEHCGATVYAQDIFQKIKDLV